MALPVVGLVGLLGTYIARLITVETAKLIALKAMLLVLAIVVLPLVVENFLVYLISGAYGVMDANVASSGLAPVILQITGMGGWIAEQLRLPESFAVIISGITVRFGINAIPFLRV